MNEVLLIDATEELQPLAEALEESGFRVGTCPLRDAPDRLGRERFGVLLLNLMDTPDDTAARDLLVDQSLGRAATLAVVRREQLPALDPALPLDDFLVFPAAPEELLARIRRVLQRRDEGEDANVLRRGDLVIDHASYKVYVGSRPVELTYKEYELLRFLALNEGKVCTRETLLSRVWGYDFYGGARTVDVHIRRLRSKIEDRTHTLIETVRNVGYRFRAG